MKVTIWGSRGSIPASIKAESIRKKIFTAIDIAKNVPLNDANDINRFIDEKLPFCVRSTYGTNTSCVELNENEGEYFLLDAGSGLRDFGNTIMQKVKQPCRFHIFLSHLHWDHIHGFPFFTPAFIKGNRIDFYAFHDQLESAFVSQQGSPYFPVPFEYMQSDKHFHLLKTNESYDICGFTVKGIEQAHHGKSYGYSFEKDGKKIVYSTDSEHILDYDHNLQPFIQFFQNADLLIFDAQYALMDVIQSKKTWGHSSNVVGLELAVRSRVKHYCMFHTEPTYDDEKLDTILKETQAYHSMYSPETHMKISIAYDGLIIEV
ncbi:MAG: MBL fold metallo-hydrolase [Candidatus Magnetomorum sp.]|nr:MBL fold metallo-hydrolase [Candidatus Magnetomorum sp.]